MRNFYPENLCREEGSSTIQRVNSKKMVENRKTGYKLRCADHILSPGGCLIQRISSEKRVENRKARCQLRCADCILSPGGCLYM